MDPISIGLAGTILDGVNGFAANLGNLFTAGANRRFQEKMYNLAVRDSYKMADYQYNQNLKLWNLNNEYNSPANQIARLKAANINPNLAYAKGTITNTSNSASVSAPSSHNQPQGDKAVLTPFSVHGLELAQFMLDQKLQSEQIKNLESERKVNEEKAANLKADANLKSSQKGVQDYTLETLLPIQAEISELEKAIKKGNKEEIEARVKRINEIVDNEVRLGSEKVKTQEATTLTTKKQGEYYDAGKQQLLAQVNALNAQANNLAEQTRHLRLENDADVATNAPYVRRVNELNEQTLKLNLLIKQGKLTEASAVYTQLQSDYFKWKTDNNFINWLDRLGLLPNFQKAGETAVNMATMLLLAPK